MHKPSPSILLTLLAACSAPSNPAQLVEAHYTARVAPALDYEPGTTTLIDPPRDAKPGPEGEQWVAHRYTVATPQGGRKQGLDTLVVEPDGRVLFY